MVGWQVRAQRQEALIDGAEIHGGAEGRSTVNPAESRRRWSETTAGCRSRCLPCRTELGEIPGAAPSGAEGAFPTSPVSWVAAGGSGTVAASRSPVTHSQGAGEGAFLEAVTRRLSPDARVLLL